MRPTRRLWSIQLTRRQPTSQRGHDCSCSHFSESHLEKLQPKCPNRFDDFIRMGILIARRQRCANDVCGFGCTASPAILNLYGSSAAIGAEAQSL